MQRRIANARFHARLGLIAVLIGAWVTAVPTASGAVLSLESPGTVPTTLSDWNGGVNLYRNGVFTTQKSWLWCTAAGIQIVRNIVRNQEDHSTTTQRRLP